MIEVAGLAAQFGERAARLNVRVHPVAPDGEAVALVAILDAVEAASVAVAVDVPGRAALLAGCADAGRRIVEPTDRCPDRRADVGVSIAKMAAAETGSLVVRSASEDRRVELRVDAASPPARPTRSPSLTRSSARPTGRSPVVGPSRR